MAPVISMYRVPWRDHSTERRGTRRERMRTCHTEQVAQLKSDPFMKRKTCVTCHPPHGFMVHKKAVATVSNTGSRRQLLCWKKETADALGVSLHSRVPISADVGRYG